MRSLCLLYDKFYHKYKVRSNYSLIFCTLYDKIIEYTGGYAQMKKWESRTGLLIGEKAVEKLNGARVLIFGLGGVGSYAVEALSRAGIGHFTLVDGDKVSETNINRQIIATVSTVGKSKCEVSKSRILDVNPDAKVDTKEIFYLPENADSIDFSKYDYVVDAVDTVTAKIEIVKRAKLARVPVISAMGTGNKLHPIGFRVGDVYDTKVCPLARVMRRELKSKGITSLKVVYSEEEPIIKERVPASISFVPSVAGLILASEVIKDLIKQ